MWTQPSNSIEYISAAFDAHFWQGIKTDANGNKYIHGPSVPVGREFRIPPPPKGVNHWGLRTLWCYWIDRHLAETEKIAGEWAKTAKTVMNTHAQSPNAGAKRKARQFMQAFMGTGGMVTSTQLRYPRNANGGSNSQSPYNMWGNNNFGILGI